MYKYWTKEDWEKVLWTNEALFSVVRQCDKMYVHRRVGEELSPQCVTSTVKHGGDKIQVWSCFTANGVGHLYHIKGIMDQKMYKQILIHHMRPSMMQLGGKETIIFQQDKDPKYDPNLGTPPDGRRDNRTGRGDVNRDKNKCCCRGFLVIVC